MAAWNDILKAKLETLLGERGTGKDAALRRGEADALLTKAATLAAAKAEKAAKAQASEALTVARRAEAAVQSMVASVAETTVQTASDDTAQNERLFQAMSDLFQWNGGSYSLRVPAAGVIGRVGADQIADAAIGVAKFASGISPVEIVSSLPASGNFQGRTVFLTTDNKLYRHTGSAWTKATDGADIIANSITAGQIQAGAISTDQLAAGAITAEKLAIGDFTNFVANGRNEDFTSDPTVYWVEALAGGDAYYSTSAITSARSLAIAKPVDDLTVSAYLSSKQYVPVQAGAEYYGETAIRCNTGTTTAGATYQVLWYDADKGYLTASNIASNVGVTTTFQTFTRIVTAPSGACFARFRIFNRETQTTARIMYYDRMLFWRANAGQLIVDGSITASHLVTNTAVITGSAQIKDLTITSAHITSVDAEKITAGSALAGSITVNNTALDTVRANAATGAQDPVTRINAGSTQIDPGKIRISGSTTLSDWRMGGDETRINGGSISANTIDANKLTIGSRGITVSSIEFEHNSPSANSISWTGGSVRYINDAGSAVSVSITAGNAAWTSGVLFIYWVKGATTFSTTTSQATAMGSDNVVIACYSGGANLVENYGRTIIDGSNIKTGTITANQLTTTNAVITGQAQIADAVIRTAHIGDLQVDTLQIKDSAVTALSYAYAAASVLVDSTTTETTISSVTVARIAGYSTRIGFGCQINNPRTSGNQARIEFRLYRGATLIQSWIMVADANSESIGEGKAFFFADTNTSAGSTTYSLRAVMTADGRSGNISKRSLEAQQFKK